MHLALQLEQARRASGRGWASCARVNCEPRRKPKKCYHRQVYRNALSRSFRVISHKKQLQRRLAAMLKPGRPHQQFESTPFVNTGEKMSGMWKQQVAQKYRIHKRSQSIVFPFPSKAESPVGRSALRYPWVFKFLYETQVKTT